MYQQAAHKLLLPGTVGVIATDTVYGVVARAADPVAVERLYALKNRERKPGTIIAASIEDLTSLGIARSHLERVAHFWPGAVSVETPHDVAYLHQGTGRQALRIPDDAALRALLAVTGPLQTSSANQPGEAPATTVDEAQAYFGETVDFYDDGGNRAGSAPSTIIRIGDAGIEIIREGAVKIVL